jgi:hypothetical protein
MTLRKNALEERSKDELGVLIQWSLQERVGDAVPPAETWERIRTRANRMVVWKKRRSQFYRGYRAAMVQLFKVKTFLLAQITAWLWPQGRWVEWRFDPRFTRLLFDQYGFFLLRVAF